MRDVHTSPLAEVVRRRLLTFVLLTVLVWYTLVVPAPASFIRRPAGGPPDAEERNAEGPAPARDTTPAPVEDLDWPEYIGG